MDGARVVDSEEAAVKRGFAFTATILAVALAVSLLSQLPAVSAGYWGSGAASMRLLWPQGWDFFARTAGEDRFVAYRIDGPGRVRDADVQAGPVQASPENWWGLRRRTYFRLVETDDLAGRIPGQAWVPCAQGELAKCWAPQSFADVRNPFRSSTLCGHVAFAVEHPTGDTANPWRTLRVAPVNLQCGSTP
jgi:hypothetical protein